MNTKANCSEVAHRVLPRVEWHMLKIVTYNIHKGFSHFNRRVVLHELRDRLRELDADILFLQEVQGAHSSHSGNFQDYPEGAQHDFIAEALWSHSAYGKNSVYEAGHHGNAIISRFPILRSLNTDVSAHRFESRGLLHCEIDIAGKQVHCLCAHFGLFAKGKRAQTATLIDYVRKHIPPDAPLIVAGDFNDWRNKMSREMEDKLSMQDVFHVYTGRPARSYPASLPLLRLDRIYVRGFAVLHCDVHIGGAWKRLSDHAALSAQLE